MSSQYPGTPNPQGATDGRIVTPYQAHTAIEIGIPGFAVDLGSVHKISTVKTLPIAPTGTTKARFRSPWSFAKTHRLPRGRPPNRGLHGFQTPGCSPRGPRVRPLCSSAWPPRWMRGPHRESKSTVTDVRARFAPVRKQLRRADERLRVALVTGACSGHRAAQWQRAWITRIRVDLVSNRPAELAATAQEIGKAHAVLVHTSIVADLARPEAAEELYQAVREKALQVDILISNAGFFFFGEAVDARLRGPRRCCSFTCHALLLCNLLWRATSRARGRGHILIVSSISAWRDFSRGSAYYGASKKYLRGFARALRSEMAVYG